MMQYWTVFAVTKWLKFSRKNPQVSREVPYMSQMRSLTELALVA